MKQASKFWFQTTKDHEKYITVGRGDGKLEEGRWSNLNK